MSNMKATLLDVIKQGIDDEFWCEESLIVEQYSKENDYQLDCEGISTTYVDDSSIVVTIDNKEYRITITDEE